MSENRNTLPHSNTQLGYMDFVIFHNANQNNDGNTTIFPDSPVHEWGRHCLPVLKSSSLPPPQSSYRCLASDLERHSVWWHTGGGGKGAGRTTTDCGENNVLTGHFCFGPLVVDGLTGKGVHSNLSDRHGGVFQLTVEPQDLSAFTWVLHHLKKRHIILFILPLYLFLKPPKSLKYNRRATRNKTTTEANVWCFHGNIHGKIG